MRSLTKTRAQRWILASILGVFLASLTPVLLPNEAYGLRDWNEIQRSLKFGVQTATSWDQSCRAQLEANRNMSSLRVAINNKAAYRHDVWLSLRANGGNASTPVAIGSDQRDVSLQLNNAHFLCAPLVEPSFGRSATISQVLNDTGRWVSSANTPNDRRPNSPSDSVMGPAQTYTRRQIEKVIVSSSSDIQGTFDSEMPLPTQVVMGFDPNSRYWIANPINMNFRATQAIVGTKRLVVDVYYRQIDSFGSANEASATKYCLKNGTAVRTGYMDFQGCDELSEKLEIVFVAPNPPSWQVDSASQIRKSGGSWTTEVTASPGEVVEFQHSLTNRAGSVQNAYGFEWSIGWGDYVNQGEVDRGAILEGNALQPGRTVMVSGRYPTPYLYRIPTTATPGSTYCRSIEGYVTSNLELGKPGTGKSNNACVKIAAGPAVIDIRTTFDGPLNVPIVPGDEGTWTHTFRDTTYQPYSGPSRSWNRGDLREGDFFERVDMTFYQQPEADVITRTAKTRTGYRSTSFTGKSGYYPKESDIGGRICHWFSYDLYIVKNTINSRQVVIGYEPGTDAFGNPIQVPITRTEYYISSRVEKAYTRTSNRDQCIEVGTKPKLQVWGGDLRVGGQVQTSLMRPTYRGSGTHPWYGSWSEYGLLAGGRVVEGAKSGMASASALNGGDSAKGIASTSPPNWSNLTFTNNAPQKGNFAGATGGHDSLLNQFRTLRTSTGFAGINAGQSGVFAVGNISLSGNLQPGQSLILVSSGTVTIDGNIIYPGSYANAGSIPQLVIVANAINIRENVGNVDAWLLTSGALNTCSNYASTALTLDRCSGRLQINGPVVANNLILNRTYGSRAGSSEQPAETFNYRADAAIWAREYAGSSNKIQTVDIREVPTRF